MRRRERRRKRADPLPGLSARFQAPYHPGFSRGSLSGLLSREDAAVAVITFLPVASVPSILLAAAPQAWIFLAQAQPGGVQGKPPALPELLLQYAPLAFVVLFAWLLLYRPERQRQLESQRLREGLKRNDRVVTSAGIYGIVAAVDRDNDRVTIKVDETNNVKMDVTLASIGRVLGGPADPTKQNQAQD